ncbi:MAG: hypothetical protein ACYSU1_02865 [Planctomycetota bacterium]
MVGLILAICGWLLGGEQSREIQDPPQQHVERVAMLLRDPQPDSLYWLQTLFQSLTRIEHGPEELVRQGWSWMAAEGTDAAQANFILYCRRQGLPLPEITLNEAAGSGLERALALWGDGQLEACAVALQSGLRTYPEDARYRGNLDWLAMDPPLRVTAHATSRELVQAVLATRITRP